MLTGDYKPILRALDMIYPFNPVKICFNQFELYNDYDFNAEEHEPPELVVPRRLQHALETKDMYVNRLEIIMVHGHHSLVYLYGEQIKKGCLDEKV